MTQLFEAIDAINGQRLRMNGQQSFPDLQPDRSGTRDPAARLRRLCRLEIADHFGLTENTVKTHFSNLKQDRPSISKLAIYAVASVHQSKNQIVEHRHAVCSSLLTNTV